MSSIDKKSPFKVPDGYFNRFDQKLTQKLTPSTPTMAIGLPLVFSRG